MTPSMRQKDNEEVNSESSGSVGVEQMSWKKRQRVQKNKEKWARVLKGQESEDTLPTTISSSSDLDNHYDGDQSEKDDLGSRLRRHLLETQINPDKEWKSKESLLKAKMEGARRQAKKNLLKQSFKPEREIIRPLNKIRLNTDVDSDSEVRQKTGRRAYRQESGQLVCEDDNPTCSQPDDEYTDDGDNDPMESLRVKRLSKVRQAEEERLREKIMVSKKEELRRKEQREQAKRRNLEREMSAPVATATLPAVESQKSESGLRVRNESVVTANLPAHAREIPPAAFPPLEPSQNEPKPTDTDERRKQKVLKQMFQDGLKRASPPRADVDMLAEISSQLDDAVSRASEKKKKIKKASKVSSKRTFKNNGLSTPECELRKALGMKGKESTSTPATPPLTPPSPEPIATLFKEEAYGLESSWLDNLFSNVTTCCGPTGMPSTSKLVEPEERRSKTVFI